MTFLAPGYLFGALAVAGMIAALHFIVLRLPRAGILPTARFVPDTPATTVAAARRPTDLPLMFLRMLIIVAAGAALARPVLTPSRRAEARVIVVDVSRSARDSIAMRDSARAVYRDGDAVVVFDSSARVLRDGTRDSLAALRPSAKRGNLSAALVAAMRAGSTLRDRADSLELVMVSPFAREEIDAATDTIRQLWPGRARIVTVPNNLADTITATRGLDINADADDPLVVTAELARNLVVGSSHIDRGNIGTSAAGVATTESEPGTQSATSTRADRAVIWWPSSSRPRFAVARGLTDTVGGVTTGNANVVAAFERRWMYPADSMRGADVIARWADGEPAALEKPNGTSCVRSVAIPVTPVGDLAIRHELVQLMASVSRPCAWRTALLPADPATVAALEGGGGLAPRSAFKPVTDVRSGLAPWLLALALVAAVAELVLRRRTRRAAVGGARTQSPGAEARAA